jgi:hypothetical protein
VTLDQALAFAIIIGMMGLIIIDIMGLFAWRRWRYDLVAVVALLAAVPVGIVPADKGFLRQRRHRHYRCERAAHQRRGRAIRRHRARRAQA